MKYRPDIDGLRAIAVLLVVGYHAFPERLPAGFIGVDIFFVISGFLITTIIHEELVNKKFTYTYFYKRRIKRIFSALLLLLCANCFIGWFVLFPDELQRLGVHIYSVNAFISNFILWAESGYFDSASELKPLLHFWSLGIEEQYYILWPLVVALGVRYNIKYLFIFLFVSSFLSNIITVKYFSLIDSFYLPHNRAWELMAGSLLALFVRQETEKSSRTHVQFITFWLSLVGLLCIVISLLLINDQRDFPGWWALFPVAGAACLILSQQSFFNRYVLSNKYIVYVGLISYPLYLWHWSLLSYAHITGYTSLVHIFFFITCAFIFSILTYEFIEKRIRKNTHRATVPVLLVLSLLFALLGYCMSIGVLEPRNNTSGIKKASEAAGDWEYPDGFDTFFIEQEQFFLKKGARGTVLFYGDSHVEQYGPRFVELLEQHPDQLKSVVFATRGGCLPVPNVYEDDHPLCTKEFKDTVLKYALSDDVDTVVVGASWGKLILKENLQKGDRYYYLNGDRKHSFEDDGIEYAYHALEEFLVTLLQQKKVYLLLDNPTGTHFNPKTFFTGTRVSGIVDKRMLWQEYSKQQDHVRLQLKALGNRLGVTVIDPVEHFCKEDKCRTSLEDGTPIYKDFGHIRPYYVKQYTDYIDVALTSNP
ncbi:MAG: acyltransferase [Candidatus Electrothrix sp. AU1_5]|nr:acyltransferase [Candidatus Electrothrix gigas]